MYDKFEPLKFFDFAGFNLQPIRFEIWKDGKLLNSGTFSEHLISLRIPSITKDNSNTILVTTGLGSLEKEISLTITFDVAMTSTDRIQLLTIPLHSETDFVGLETLRLLIGHTCNSKNFKSTDPFCCNIFYINKEIVKVTFAFGNPEKMIEFYM